MSELCHICDLFRTALFGPTNSSEDHLDDGQGNDLPRPMADAPATMGVRRVLRMYCCTGTIPFLCVAASGLKYSVRALFASFLIISCPRWLKRPGGLIVALCDCILAPARSTYTGAMALGTCPTYHVSSFARETLPDVLSVSTAHSESTHRLCRVESFS